MSHSKNSWLAKRHRTQIVHDLSTFTGTDNHNLIDLSIGDPDVHTPSEIIEYAFADAKAGHTHYTNGLGQQELREAVCQDMHQSFNVPAKLNQCMITTSACHAMWLALESTLDAGDEVIVFSPYFPPYGDQIKLAGGVLVDCPTDPDNAFSIDFDKLDSCITHKTKAVIINTPNNPTGQYYNIQTLSKLADVLIKNDLLVIADDIYTAFCFDSKHIAIASLPNMLERTITLGSFSKNYCMTGWRIGYVIAPEEIIVAMENINQSVIFSPPTISQRAALHAIRLKEIVQPKIVQAIYDRAKIAYEAFDSLSGVSCLKPAGGMYVFPNISGTNMTASEFVHLAFDKAEVRLVNGEGFGKAGKGHVRVALTVSENKIIEAAERLQKLL